MWSVLILDSTGRTIYQGPLTAVTREAAATEARSIRAQYGVGHFAYVRREV